MMLLPRQKPVMWTLQQAVDLIQAVQPKLQRCGYHLGLGGGVLNRGESRHDLDLYLFPLTGGAPQDLEIALAVLSQAGVKNLTESYACYPGQDDGQSYYKLYQGFYSPDPTLTQCPIPRVDVFVVQMQWEVIEAYEEHRSAPRCCDDNAMPFSLLKN